ncbi:glutathione S-transferase [Achromobacter marplatensis]|jgi:glutathione S-transferase|uniref:Glutathione S-transferase n=2 Tax=Achromobacter marplatensis TaxID=470868 RepID=J4PIE8_9BURK|nr:glutathione binding-like protein [Achromobacter marplatensis]EJO33577.1 glutathione S-transferase [Achromobacter marplatensis]MDH2050072.1 glutathione binding-like protein [Achromobacter marplatensis]OWT72340.1 glutathione S-transferase [Achromobacter marplatensis]RBP24370.1 glutathione S-transferase [Achromobacter marplatensis]CAB3626960.1 Glutathione S-transferase GST-4.5 [Achromobacter marplatensis]
MKLYYMPGACSLASHIVLEWVGKPYETHKLSREELKGPDFLKVNPLGAVPALVDGDWAVTQNASILEYIAEQAPQSKLLGDGSARSRADVRRWLGFINSDIHKTFSMIFGASRFLGDEGAQKELAGSASKLLTKLFSQLDAQLAGKAYLTGDAPSIADAYLYVVLRWAHAKEVDLSGQDNLAAFFKRMEADKGVQAALKAEGL